MEIKYTCACCGKEVKRFNFSSETPIAKAMRIKELCFDCAFWDSYMENPQPDTHIISGSLYLFFPETKVLTKRVLRSKNQNLAFAINMKDGTIVHCSKYKKITNVPHNFHKAFPDEYRFISATTYFQILEHKAKACSAKGCWDRYDCFWYDAKKTEPNGAWNVIPHYHKPGDEECESFINKNTMYLNEPKI